MRLRASFAGDWAIYGAGGVVCAAITIVAWLIAIGPAIAQHHARQERTAELATRRQKAGSVAVALSGTRRQEAAVKLDLAATNLQLSSASAVNEKLAGITRLANDCKLTIEEVQPGKTADAPFYQIVELKLAGSGTFPAFTRFLHRLHMDHRDVGLRTMESTADSANPLSPVVSFRLDLNWYATALASAAPSVAKSE